MSDNVKATETPYRRNWLITSPRTASNMLMKMLNVEAQGVKETRHGGYFFWDTMWLRMPLNFDVGAINNWPAGERGKLDALYTQIFDRIQDFCEESEKEDKPIFVKEHAFFMNDYRIENNFMFPDTPPASPGHSTDDDNKTWAPSRHDYTREYHPSYHDELSTPPARGIPHGTRSKHNLTVFPDEFLHTITPTFLIRHPAMMLPSYFRTTLDQKKLMTEIRRPGDGGATPLEMTTKWIRGLYDFYANYYSSKGMPQPMILDADDIMTSAPTLIPQYAKLAGLDPAKTQVEWEAQSGEGLSRVEKRMLDTLLASKGVDKSKIAGDDLDIDVEASKWREEFGEQHARELEDAVRAAMPDYMYLRERRLRPE